MEVLEYCRVKGKVATKIIGKVNLNTAIWKKICGLLINSGTLKVVYGKSEAGYFGRLYETTREGVKVLRQYKELIKRLKINEGFNNF